MFYRQYTVYSCLCLEDSISQLKNESYMYIILSSISTNFQQLPGRLFDKLLKMLIGWFKVNAKLDLSLIFYLV